MSKKKTHEEYVAELAIKNPNVEVTELYAGARTKIQHHCLKHNVYWGIEPTNALRGVGCKECGYDKLKEQKMRTHDEYVAELYSVNKNIIVLDTYAGNNIPIKHKCLIDGYEWLVAPGSVLAGNGCAMCSGNAKKTTEQYENEVHEINDKIVVLDEYINTDAAIRHQCLIDGHIWLAKPNNILNGTGCPKCANNVKKTQDEYIDEVKVVNPDIEVIGEYVNAKTHICHKCRICNHAWMITPSDVLAGNGCPQCHESSGERRIRQWLERHNIVYVFQKTFDDCKDKRVLPFDFYLPHMNVIIEYDDKQHEIPIKHFGGEEKFNITVKHDLMKNKYCKDNNIQLLRIPYFKNIEEELNNFLFI